MALTRAVAIGVGVALIGATALAGCSTSLVVDGSTVTVALAQPFTSFNDQTTFGNTPTNSSIVGATNAGFAYYDDTPALVLDESFGHIEIVSQEPFEVKYTVAEGVTWSDGEPVDGADLLLAWAANSGVFNTEAFNPSRFTDPESGQFTEFPDDVVFFDGAHRSGLQYVTQTPELGDDGRSITLRYDEYFVDWQLAFDVGLPAHVVAEQAFTFRASDDETAGSLAKKAMITAIEDADTADLAALAVAWNSAFNSVTSPALLVSSGPYAVSALTADEVTLTANPLYTGERKPRFETVVVTTITDPLAAVRALGDGTVDVIAPTPTEDVARALASIDGATVKAGHSSTFEHVDLQFSASKNGTFDDPLLREAFLLTVPREQIVDELIRPISPDASVRNSFVLAEGGEGLTQNLAAAKALITRAGATAPPVCVLFDPSNPRRVTEFELIEKSAEKAGFVVSDCSASDWQGFLGVADSYDAALFAWTETSIAVSSPEARLRSTSSVSNYSHFASAEVDRLLDQLSVEEDADEQQALLAQIDAELWAESYGVPLFQFPSLVAFASTVEGVAPSALSGPLWNLWAWQPPAESE